MSDKFDDSGTKLILTPASIWVGLNLIRSFSDWKNAVMRISRISALLPIVLMLSACGIAKNKEPDQLAAPPRMAMETDLLTATPGYTGKILGAEVLASESGPLGEEQIIEINVPIDPDQVDRVEVISATGETIKQRRTAEILRNYENDNVGITLFLSREKNWRFKLKLIDNKEDY